MTDQSKPDQMSDARALIEHLTGYTPGPWSKHKCQCGHPSCNQHTISTQGSVGFDGADARLIAAAPDLLATVHRLLDALDAERAKVAAAYEGAASILGEYMSEEADELLCDIWREDIRALTPADAQATLDKLLDEARLEGWRAGQEAMRERCERAMATPALRDHVAVAPARIIRALPIEDLPEDRG